MRDLIARWRGESVVTAYDEPSDTWMFIALHDTTLGPAMGGVRMRVYPVIEDALIDAMRLAEGMTYKWATIGFGFGGGKGVLAVRAIPTGDERIRLFRRFGRLVESLRGGYSCGPDLGTTPEDMATISLETTHVHGVRGEGRETVDPGPFTALGVFSGIKAALRHIDGSDALDGKTVLVEGVGDVGAPLARMLGAANARVVIADLDAARAQALAEEIGGETVSADRVIGTVCDVYAPCAVGATVNATTIPLLQCRIVAGSANNQLFEPADADRLHARGVLYAPDYVINAGGATALPLLEMEDPSEEDVRGRIRGFDAILTEIFEEASRDACSPLEAAHRRVERRLRGDD
ncbi:MAG TPA: Glu/Leu/Phe/Val dehydrogenase dimerization domain-containing protein [Gemmatimonadales bacterium]|jgi:leucine dehydrogenase